jgi:PIN domain nuclease of toxin-antitoxin system
MSALLDTHTFLWVVLNDRRISPLARAFIADRTHRIFFSTVGVWEIVTKWRLGKLELSAEPGVLIPRQLSLVGIEPLPVSLEHALRGASLPPLHRDPWDRLMVAQALAEDLPIITSDRLISQYPVQTIW